MTGTTSRQTWCEGFSGVPSLILRGADKQVERIVDDFDDGGALILPDDWYDFSELVKWTWLSEAAAYCGVLTDSRGRPILGR